MSQPSQGKPSGQRTQTRERDDAPAQSSAQEQPTGQAVAPRSSKTEAMVEIVKGLDERTEQLMNALPAHIPVERFKRVVILAVQNSRNLELLECDKRSVFNACVQAATDGLLPDGREGALVVRLNRQSPTGKSANWQPMIQGIRKKARNSGEIATWETDIVHANDKFIFRRGDDAILLHEPLLAGDRGPMIGAYSIAKLKDGSISREFMRLDEINKIRDKTDAYRAFKAGKIKDTPWHSNHGEMSKKTVCRRHAKVLPMSSDLDDLIRRDDSLYAMEEASDRRVGAPRPRLTQALAQIGSRVAPSATTDAGVEEEGGLGRLADDDSPIGDDDSEGEESEAGDGKPSEKPAGAGNAGGATSDAADGEKRAGDAGAKGKAAAEGKAAKADDRTPQRVAFDEGVDAKAKGRLPSAMPAEYGEAGAESLRTQWRRGHKGDAWAGEIEAA